jgi:hypothetical protein
MDIAYSDASGGGAKTTSEVAEILENKYHPFTIFFEERKSKIGEWLAEAMADEIASIINGRPRSRDPYFPAMEKIEKEFRQFLDADEISKILPITQQITAAQLGKNSRKKKGYNKNYEARPALIDTGLFQSAFRAWITS